jgi:Ser/Thr protein kinase RdoA (MazF antagonist)
LDEAFAAACRDVGVNTPPPVFWGGHGGNFPVSIRPFVPGSVLDQLPGPNVDVYADCGHQLALIHSAKTTLAREWFYELPIANLRREPRMKWSQDQLARQAYRLFHDSAHQVDDSAWNRGLIHSDFRAGNIVINSDGIPVILDWEKATVGPICFDLGLALFHIMTEEREQHAAARLEAFISGYGRSSSLASDIADDLQSITSYAASTFYLVDYDIASRHKRAQQSNNLDDLHHRYYLHYCRPAFAHFSEGVVG